jgi:hypothetical protein
MSASEKQRAEWLDAGFWEKLDRLEGRHQQAQAKHDSARRGLERLSPGEIEELHRAWSRYCEVIAELDESTAEFEALMRR